MRIAWVIPCRYAEIHEGLATIVGAGTNVFWVPAFPAPIGVTIVLHLAAPEPELAEPHHLRGEVLGPDMQPLEGTAPLEGDIQFEAGPNKPPGWEGSITMPAFVQFVAPEEGIYTLQLSVDNRSTTVALVVQQGPPPESVAHQ